MGVGREEPEPTSGSNCDAYYASVRLDGKTI